MEFKHNNVVDPAPWVKLARILAREARITVQFEHGDDPRPRIDLGAKRMYVPMPSPYWSQSEQLVWAGMVIHEIGHASPECRDAGDVIQDNDLDMRSRLGFVVNLLEDYRQEKTNLGVYRGRDQALAAVQAWGASQMTPDKIENPENIDKLTVALMSLYYHLRARWQPAVGMHTPQWERIALEYDCKSEVSDLMKYAERIDTLPGRTGQDVYDLAVEILSDLEDKTPEEVIKESQPLKFEDLPEELQEALKAARELLPHAHEGTETGAEGEAKGEASDETDDKGPRAFENVTLESDGTEPYTYQGRYKFVSEFSDRWHEYERPDAIRQHLSEVSNLAGVVRKLLQTRTQTKYSGGHKRGRVNSRALYRASHVDTVFKRKDDTIDLDVAVQLVIDCSGSMSGSRYSLACAAAIGLTEAIQPNGIALDVIGFSTSSGQDLTEMYGFKQFHERLDQDRMIQRFSSNTVALDCNADGEALLYAARRLEARDERRKIMIVLSDGQPSSHYRYDRCTKSGGRQDEKQFLYDVVQRLSRTLEVYGIGIKTPTVERYYPEYAVLQQAGQLKDCLLNTIKEKILR